MFDHKKGMDVDTGKGPPHLEYLLLFAPGVREQLAELDDCYQHAVVSVAKFIQERYVYRRHQLGSGIFDESGRGFFGTHLEAMVGRASICAEAIALGSAVANGCSTYRLIVTVRHPLIEENEDYMRLVPPCGLCRELLSDYCENMSVLVPAPDGNSLSIVSISQLLPNKYVGSKWRSRQP